MLFFNLFLSISPLLLSWSFQSLKCSGMREGVARLFAAAWSVHPPLLRWPECRQPGPFSAPFPSSNPQLFSFFCPLTNILFLLLFSLLGLYTQERGELHAKSPQSCLALCDSMDHSPPGSSVHEILQARILEWVVVPSSRVSSQPRESNPHLLLSWIDRWVLYH